MASRKNFSSFDLPTAFKYLGIKRFQPWVPEVQPQPLSAFLQERLRRLKRYFNLRGYEDSKKLIVDALCEEGIEGFETLKIWKGAALKSDRLNGNVDYLIAENKEYLEAPFLCIVEAKKDDFEQGLAQCLVEMDACQWNNQQINQTLTVFGIVTNGDGWQFYKFTSDRKIYETELYGMVHLDLIIAILRYIFAQCETQLTENL